MPVNEQVSLIYPERQWLGCGSKGVLFKPHVPNGPTWGTSDLPLTVSVAGF
jgi:hypothetical protein